MDKLSKLEKEIKLAEIIKNSIPLLNDEKYSSLEKAIKSCRVNLSYVDFDFHSYENGYLTANNLTPLIVIDGNKSEVDRRFALLELFIYALLEGHEANLPFKSISEKEAVYSRDNKPLKSTRIASQLILPHEDFKVIHEKLGLLYSGMPSKMMDFLIKENIKKAYGIPEKAYLSYL